MVKSTKKWPVSINTMKVSYNGKSASAAYPWIRATWTNKPVQRINNMAVKAAQQSIAKKMGWTPYGNLWWYKSKGMSLKQRVK